MNSQQSEIDQNPQATLTEISAESCKRVFFGAGTNFCNVCHGRGRSSAATAADCMANTVGGRATECPSGDYCGAEVRMKRGEMTSINIQCMSEDVCGSQTSQNFIGTDNRRTQCRPEAILQGRRYGSSVCRNCVAACEDTNTGCFDPSRGICDIFENCVQLWELDRTGWIINLAATYSNA